MDCEYASQCLSYDPETGVLTWKLRPREHFKSGSGFAYCKRRAGKKAGHLSAEGYIVVGIGWKVYKAHRVAWLLFYGVWPEHELDHVDGDKGNNRILNLRDAPHAVNMRNTGRRPPASGIVGVHWDARYGKWIAQTARKGRGRYVGSFHSKEDAASAVQRAREQEGDYSARHQTQT